MGSTRSAERSSGTVFNQERRSSSFDARFPGLETVDFSRVRLYDTLTTTYGCRPTRARESFEPVLLTAAEAAVLDQRRGAPALRVERIAFDQDDVPIEFCRSTVRGDRYRYSVELRDR